MSKTAITTATLETDAQREISISEVSHLTGYNSQYLRRLEKDNLIPASHKVGGMERNGEYRGGVRSWFAHEVKKILDYRWKTLGESEKRIVATQKKAAAANKKS